jgi:hypothetical protein
MKSTWSRLLAPVALVAVAAVVLLGFAGRGGTAVASLHASSSFRVIWSPGVAEVAMAHRHGGSWRAWTCKGEDTPHPAKLVVIVGGQPLVQAGNLYRSFVCKSGGQEDKITAP